MPLNSKNQSRSRDMSNPPIAFRMQLKPGCEAEYKRRHDEIWPDLVAILRDSGINDYCIFFDEASLTLFAVLSLIPNHQWGALAQNPLMHLWWEYMADLMIVKDDNRPVEDPLRLIFRLP